MANTAMLFWYGRRDGDASWRYFPAVDASRPGVVIDHGAEVVISTGKFVVRERVDGKPLYHKLNEGETPQDALARVQRAAQGRQLRAQLLAPVPRTEAPATTLATRVEEYIANRKQHRKLKAAENARLVLGDFIEVTGLSTVKGVKAEHLSAYIAALHQRGQADRTISNKYDRLRAFLKWAGNDAKLSTDDRPKFEKKLPTVYTRAELDALMQHADEYMRVVIAMGTKLGLREQELMHAEWADIDREQRVFRVKSKPAYDFKVKDSEQRDAPITGALMDVLTAWHSTRPQSKLILGIGRKHDRVDGHLLRRLKQVAKRAGVEDATLHKMRRYYLTTLLRSGVVDLRTAQAFVGHSDLASTMRYLTPASASEMQSKMDGIEF
jgi:integrase